MDAACTYDNRTSNLTAIQERYLLALRLATSNVTWGIHNVSGACGALLTGPLAAAQAEFDAAMCSVGYTGRMCGGAGAEWGMYI